ncbi:DUF5050 domain-containing protein [Brevibacillus reuszeri]|uniref:DUF5050 domain-containing protein n=1 Tax=Brevibacillus reuszeri TaxID=54915 RepID=UPI003D1D3215
MSISLIILIIFQSSGYVSANQETNNNVGGGWIAEDPSWIYFGYGGKLIKISKTDAKKVVLNNATTKGINVKGDWIYFTQKEGNDWNKYSLYKMKVDGTNKKRITGTGIDKVFVYGDYIYYTVFLTDPKTGYYSPHSLYRMKTDGTNKSLVFNGVADSIHFSGNNIFFINVTISSDGLKYSGPIMKSSLDGKNITTLIPGENRGLQVVENRLYFSDEIGLHQVDVNSLEKQTIIDQNIKSFYISNQWVYYVTRNISGNHLNKVKFNGTENIKIHSTPYYLGDISIIGDSVYFRHYTVFMKLKHDSVSPTIFMN